jgi:OOP family OmpA-OmpF porin
MTHTKLFNIFLTSLLIFTGLNSMAQQAEEIKTLKPAQLKNFGRNADRVGDTYSAINYYEKYCELKPDNVKIRFRLAHLYRKARDYKKALTLFEKCYKEAPADYPLALYYLAHMQKMTGQYDLAKESFTRYKKENSNDKSDESRIFRKLATNEIVGCDLAKTLIDKPLKIVITHLDTSINKAHVEFAPFPINDSTLLYSSLKEERLNYYISAPDSAAKMPVRQLYLARKKNNEWSGGKKLPGPFNLEDVQTGNGSYSPDRKKFYFNRCAPNWAGKMICAIYVSSFVKDAWQTPVKMDERINNPKFTSTQPAVGSESKFNYEVLYFISDRPGGKGGTDIWYTVYDGKKKIYKDPQNAGGKINTIGDEFSPFYDMETRALYFSSTGWPGLGGFDSFKCNGEVKNWTTPTNVGYPLNSSADDLYGAVNKNQETGFFVSNREGGISLQSATCCDDIYTYKYTKYIHLDVSGIVYETNDSKASGDSSLSGRIPVKPNTLVSLYLIDADKNEIFIRNDSTDSKGNFSFKLEQGNSYKLQVNAAGYLNKKLLLSTKNNTASETIKTDLGIQKIPNEPIVIKNIYYPFDKATLTDESKVNVDTSIFVLLNENPQIIIEVSSHTDNKGADDYNLKLSQKRAESVVTYLISKGIEKNRLVAKGYGETKQIAPNTNPDGSDNPEGRKMNRRTELRVTGVLEKKVDIIYKD